MKESFDILKELKEGKSYTYTRNSSRKNISENIGIGIAICISIFLFYLLFNLPSPKEIKNNSVMASRTSKEQNYKPKPTVPTLKVLKSGVCVVDQLGTLGVCGIIKNTSDRYISYAQININLYDHSHNLIASALDNITNIPPNGTWAFHAIPLSINIPIFYSYEIINVSWL